MDYNIQLKRVNNIVLKQYFKYNEKNKEQLGLLDELLNLHILVFDKIDNSGLSCKNIYNYEDIKNNIIWDKDIPYINDVKIKAIKMNIDINVDKELYFLE